MQSISPFFAISLLPAWTDVMIVNFLHDVQAVLQSANRDELEVRTALRCLAANCVQPTETIH